jgi:hypothetical protein
MNLSSQPICVTFWCRRTAAGVDAVRADGGPVASVLNGINDPSGEGNYSGENQGGGMVRAPFTFIRGEAGRSLGGSSQWIQSPTGFSDRSYFRDPMRKGSPPPPAPGLRTYRSWWGLDGATIQQQGNIQPGNYCGETGRRGAGADR